MSAAEYYSHSTYPATGAQGSSAAMRAELELVETGFGKLPDLSGNGLKIIAVNSGATALEAITTTGTGSGVRATSPTLVTPVLGVATATSINKVAITAPASAATLTLADGSTLATSGANSITLTSTGATNVTLPTTGTLATLAGSETLTNKTLTTAILNGTVTGTSQATANTASTLVMRDASGNFAAGTITAALTGNASTATTLQTARNINGTSFNGSADITVTAAAGTLTGATLAAGVTASSLTSVGTLTSLAVTRASAIPATFTRSTSGRDVVAIIGSAGSAQTLYLGTDATYGVLAMGADWTGNRILMDLTSEIILQPNNSTVGVFSSAGLAITGTLSVSSTLTLTSYGSGGGAVTVGAADSGGAGFKLLRVPN